MSGHRISLPTWRRWAVYISAIATIGAVAATVSVGSAGASPARRVAAAANVAKPPPAVVPRANMKASQKAIMSYWTPARMASAKPAQPVVSGTAA